MIMCSKNGTLKSNTLVGNDDDDTDDNDDNNAIPK